MHQFHADLVGHDEVPLVITDAEATLRASLDAKETELTYELSWRHLESEPVKAHIHLGKPGTNGGEIVTLASRTGKDVVENAVPTMSGLNGTLQGTVGASHVVRVTMPLAGREVFQGVDSKEFVKFVGALKSGYCYVNIHTENYSAPAGVVRGQIRVARAPDDLRPRK